MLVAGAASGLGLYHERLGSPCDELRLSTPTSQRRGPDVGGNWFAPARIAVPTAAGPQGPHFEVVADRLTRRVEPALRLAPVLASTVNHLPAQVLIPVLHSQAGTVDFAATAIPGLHGSGHICGARIETSYPFGPRLGCPVNLDRVRPQGPAGCGHRARPRRDHRAGGLPRVSRRGVRRVDDVEIAFISSLT